MPMTITIKANRLWDEAKEEFYTLDKDVVLQLEHSLVSISKWESKWHKAFISNTPKTIDETKDYIRCMTINSNINPMVYNFITDQDIRDVQKYIDDPMTASKFGKEKETGVNKKTTSEMIYYMMIKYGIPDRYEKWHLNRLMALIKTCKKYSEPPKKMSMAETYERNRRLNEERRAALHSKG